MPFSQNTFKYLSKLFILCISFKITQSFFTFLWIPKNNRKKKRKIPPLKNIQCLKYIFLNNHFSQISSREDIPQNQHPSNRPSCCKIQRNLRNFDVPPLFLNNKKKKKRRKREWRMKKKIEIAQETSGKDNKRSLFIETSVATGWHVRFIYDAIEPLPINPSTSRVSCEDESRVGWSISSGYQDDIETIVAWKSPPWEWKKSSENVFQRKNYDRLAGIGYVCALDGDSFILSKTDVSFKERDNSIIIVLNAVDGSDS